MKHELPACPVEITMGLIGDKWKVLIIRDLLTGTKKFGELLKSLNGISKKVLTDNLRDMEKSELIKREVFPEVPPRVEYSLTDTGWSLNPVLDSMVEWGNNYRKKQNPKTIVFASLNPKKAVEMQRMAPKGIKILCLKDIPEATDIHQADENGTTFLENATIKAKYWAEKLKMPVLAEDSGITIDALNGYPGVYTKRCIEKFRPGTNVNADEPAELYPIILELMKESGNTDTTAHWFSAMAYIDFDKTIFAEESLDGDMCQCAGEREFGFDQYFKAKGCDKTLSELSPEEKDNIGPRKKAFESILKQL